MELKYCMPTRVLMGRDCVRANAAELAPLGKKALIVTGSSSSRANGSLADALAALGANGQASAVFDGIPENPGPDCVYSGAELARKEGCDFVIAVGGGSPMDAAKVIALLAKTDLPRKDLLAGKVGEAALPLVHIPTTAGTGSEVTQYAIITNDEAETKTGIATPLFFPKIALLDARYMESLSRRTMVNTVIDSLSHSIEGIVSKRATEITDTLATTGISIVGECLLDLAEGSLSDGQRERLLLASTLGGMVIANTGTTALHAMGYSLTYYRGIEHGRANGLLLVPFLGFIRRTRPDLTRKVLSSLRMNSLPALQFMLDRLLGERETINAQEAAKFAAKAIASKNIANGAVAPAEADLVGVFAEAFGPARATANFQARNRSIIEFVRLGDYFPAELVRTIPQRLRGVPPGATEIPVEFELSAKFASTLRFTVPWDGKVLAFVRENEKLRSVFSGDMAKESAKRRILVNDWGDAFLVTFENGARDRETTFFVQSDEVRDLFDRCSVLPEGDEVMGGL